MINSIIPVLLLQSTDMKRSKEKGTASTPARKKMKRRNRLSPTTSPKTSQDSLQQQMNNFQLQQQNQLNQFQEKMDQQQQQSQLFQQQIMAMLQGMQPQQQQQMQQQQMQQQQVQPQQMQQQQMQQQQPIQQQASMEQGQPDLGILEDLMSVSADASEAESDGSNQAPNQPTNETYSATPPRTRRLDYVFLERESDSDSRSDSGSDHERPGPSGLNRTPQRPGPENLEPAQSPFSPHSPSIIEFYKKDAKKHKKNLTNAQIHHITINVSMNHWFGVGRRYGFRCARRKKKQPFVTKSKSQLIKNYYKHVYPQKYREWGEFFDKVVAIKPHHINKWLRNIALYGSIEAGVPQNLPELPNPLADAEAEQVLA